MTINLQTFGLLFALLLVLLTLLIWRSLHRVNSAVDNNYDWLDLLLENGRASRAAHVLLGAFAVTTWFFIYAALTGRMTEGYFGLYATAWIAPVVARLIFSPTTHQPPPPRQGSES